MSPSSHAVQRSPRVHLPRETPAIIRTRDGTRQQGELEIVSLTGGLVSLPRPLERGTRVKLMFTMQKGAILGSAKMLSPVDGGMQPFRFVKFGGSHKSKLKAAIQAYSGTTTLAEARLREATRPLQRTFFGDLLGYNGDGDDVLGVNRDATLNCPACGIAGHNHTATMSRMCARQLLRGDDQTGKMSVRKSVRK